MLSVSFPSFGILGIVRLVMLYIIDYYILTGFLIERKDRKTERQFLFLRHINLLYYI